MPKSRSKSLFENFIFTSIKYTKQGATLVIDHIAVNWHFPGPQSFKFEHKGLPIRTYNTESSSNGYCLTLN